MTKVEHNSEQRLYTFERDGKPVLESYTRNLNDILNQAAAADVLGLGWSVQGYHCPTGDENVQVREYRITVWRELVSDTLPLSPDSEEKSNG